MGVKSGSHSPRRGQRQPAGSGDRLTLPNYTWKMYTSLLSTAWKNRCSDGALGLWQPGQPDILGVGYLTPCLLQGDFFFFLFFCFLFQGNRHSLIPPKNVQCTLNLANGHILWRIFRHESGRPMGWSQTHSVRIKTSLDTETKTVRSARLF